MSAMRRGEQVIRPEWFDLPKYEPQKTLDLAGWLLQVAIRRDLRSRLEAEQQLASKDEPGFNDEVLGWIHDNPILTMDLFVARFGRGLSRVMFPSTAVLLDAQPRNHMGVHSTTVEELYRFELGLRPNVRKPATAFFERIRREIAPKEGSEEYAAEVDNRVLYRKQNPDLAPYVFGEDQAWVAAAFLTEMDHPIQHFTDVVQRNFLMTVDLSLHDALLHKQLQDALDRVRAYLPNDSKLSTRNLSDPTGDWPARQLLAYMDLWLWRMQKGGRELSDSEVVELLWPGDKKDSARKKRWGVQTIRDTVRPIAEEIFAEHSEMFWNLEARVAGELAIPSLDLPRPDNLISALRKPQTRRDKDRPKTSKSKVPPEKASNLRRRGIEEA